MGGSHYDRDAYVHRTAVRASAGIPTFKHHDDVRTGKVKKAVHDSLNPFGLKMREARDSNQHPVTVPIAMCNDLTGSMQNVPIILQEKEPELMGLFLKDRAEGKKYLGEGYPAILVAGVDDYYAIGPKLCFQIGQFESGLEIDDNITNLLLTGNGGGNEGESYDLFLYALARHTAHDHWDKRHRKGHAFIIGDEPVFKQVDKDAIQGVFGDAIEGNIPIRQIIGEVQKRYNLFYLIPNQTSHFDNPQLREHLHELFGKEHVLLLHDPTKICELIVSTVAMCEGIVTLDDLAADNVATGAVRTALVPLSKTTQNLSRHDASALPVMAGGGKADRV